MFKIDELLKATAGRLISGPRTSGARGISIDTRTINPQDAFLAIKGHNFDGHNFIREAVSKGASCIIRQAGRRYQCGPRIACIEVKDTLEALGDIARFQRKRFNIPLIAVTGSNGKTTTKEMVAYVLTKRYRVLKNEGTQNNHIGLPMTLLKLNNSYDLAVVEIGTNHFGEVGYLSGICQANIGVITNIGPSHLEYLRSPEGVLREKYNLVKQLNVPCVALLNADDGLLARRIARGLKRPIALSFAVKHRADFTASCIRRLPEMLEFKVNQKYKFTLRTVGYYNIYNALSAVATARIFGMGYRDISARLKQFSFPAGRLKIRRIGVVKFIDDTYNSNPLSLRQAISALGSYRNQGRKVFVMGDMLELGVAAESFHAQAGRQLAKVCDVFISVGKLARLTAAAARIHGLDKSNIFICSSSSQARDVLFHQVSPGREDLVLVKGSRSMMMEEVFKT